MEISCLQKLRLKLKLYQEQYIYIKGPRICILFDLFSFEKYILLWKEIFKVNKNGYAQRFSYKNIYLINLIYYSTICNIDKPDITQMFNIEY